MPRKDGRLTPQEQRLAAAHVITGDISEAARRAGYSHVNAGHNALARPAVAAEVIRIQRERLAREGLPLALDTLFSIMANELAPAGARVQAAKVVLDNARPEDAGIDKSIADMLRPELDAKLEEIHRRRAELAKVIAAEVIEQAPKKGVFE